MAEAPRILVLGANGQVGWELCRTLAVLGQVLPVTRNGPPGQSLDLSEAGALTSFLDRHRPDVIVNAAAYTAVDKAEAEPVQAHVLNATVPEYIGQWAAPRGVPVIHYSTDYVFDGSKTTPYNEEDTPAPAGVYGASKLVGDQALLASGADAWILRVGWVYGLRGHNFLLTMRRLLAERATLGVVDDQVGAPTWSRLIAEASALLLVQVLRGDDAVRETRGIYHLAPSGLTSWHGFASAIRDELRLDCDVKPITTADYPTPARRPANSRLDSARIKQVFGIHLPDWHESLKDCLANE